MSFEEIIVEVQSKPLLWMSSDPNYKNRAMRAKLWREMATKLCIEEEVLKKRWKHLKDQYRKELKKKPYDWISPWKYFQSMEFIRDEVMPVAYYGNLNHLEVDRNADIQKEEDSTDADGEIYDSFAASPTSQSPAPSMSHHTPFSRKRGNNAREEILEIERKKIKLLEKTLNQSSEEEDYRNDADYLFLRSILPSMKRLNDYQKLCFRGKINDWLMEALAPVLEK